MKRRSLIVSAVLATLIMAPGQAQPPVPPPPVPAPPPPPHTLWSFLGIPQGMHKVHGALFNRHGHHPKHEATPALRALNDPRNLAPDAPPVIRKAAEIKIAEDMKRQKIKAIRYLSQIGCGCYDTDGSITAALVAASDDCTEEVRLATVTAIADAASAQPCGQCGTTCCCKEPIVMRLAAMAYERDDFGCWLEPSARVRQAATEALMICCPSAAPPIVIETLPDDGREVIPREVVPRETAPGNGAPPLPPVIDGSVQHRPAKALPSEVHRLGEALGAVIFLDAGRQLAHVHFEEQELHMPVGSRLVAYRSVPGGGQLTGQVEVVESFAGSANVRPLDAHTLQEMRPGDHVTVRPAPVIAGGNEAQLTAQPKVSPFRPSSLRK
jgi:hypothetical protein